MLVWELQASQDVALLFEHLYPLSACPASRVPAGLLGGQWLLHSVGCRMEPILMQLTQSLMAISSKTTFVCWGEGMGDGMGVNLKFKLEVK